MGVYYRKGGDKMLLPFVLAIETEEDARSFEEIYESNKLTLYKYAYSILKDSPSAEDAVQDAFVALAANFEKTYSMECNQIRGYLIIIVRNAAFRIYNKRKKEISSDEVYEEDAASDDSLQLNVENEELRRTLFDMIKGLEPKYGDIIMLRYYYGMKEKDIAQTLGLSVENVKVRLFRARNILKKKLKEGGYSER